MWVECSAPPADTVWVISEAEVAPSELLNLCYYVVRHDTATSFELALIVANVLQTANLSIGPAEGLSSWLPSIQQTANFALNFLLYCACNSQFRDTWRRLTPITPRPNLINRCPQAGAFGCPGIAAPYPETIQVWHCYIFILTADITQLYAACALRRNGVICGCIVKSFRTQSSCRENR